MANLGEINVEDAPQIAVHLPPVNPVPEAHHSGETRGDDAIDIATERCCGFAGNGGPMPDEQVGELD